MSGEMIVKDVNTQALAPVVTESQMELITKTVALGATPDELKLYLYDCARQNVHPLDKLLHYTKRNGKYTPVTSIDLMRSRAADSGEYAGSDDALFTGEPEDQHFRASVTVYRLVKNTRCPFTATARWLEYKPAPGQNGKGDIMWMKMPHTMLGKCAEALALRKAFPRQLAGLYAREEMEQAEAPAPAPIRQPVRKPAATTPPPVDTSREDDPGEVIDEDLSFDGEINPEDAQEAAVTQDNNIFTGKINKITTKSGHSASRGDWKTWGLLTSDGWWINTFDAAQAAIAEKACAKKADVRIVWEPDGDFKKLLSIELASARG
jgi:phage recombination protein Bet